MNKFSIIFLLAMFGVTFTQAQSAKPKPNVEPIVVKSILKISPFHFIEGTFLMSYERMLNGDKSSIVFSAGIHSREQFYNDRSAEFGFQEELQYRFYIAPPRSTASDGKGFFFFKGLYAGPYLLHRFRNQDIQVFDWVLQQNILLNEQINEISGGVLMGVQIALGNRFYVDLFTGGGIKRSFGRNPQNTNIYVGSIGYNGVVPKIGFQLGVGF